MDYLLYEGLLLCSQCIEDNVLYTYENSFTGGRSKLDMFIVSEKVIICRTIVMNIKLNVPYSQFEEMVFTKKVSWKKADEINILAYKHILWKVLNKIRIRLNAVHCKNMFCKKHLDDIDRYYSAIIASCKKAASRWIPTTTRFYVPRKSRQTANRGSNT
jgi:hypothetical protein